MKRVLLTVARVSSPPMLERAHSRRTLLLAVLAFAGHSGLLTACGEDDADRIDAFIAAVTGEVTTARIDHVLDTYLALDQRPLSTTVLGDMRLYREEDAATLREAVHRRLQRVLGSSLKVLRRHVDLRGTTARVELQLFGDNLMGNVVYELAKLDDKRWIITLVRVGN